MQNSFVSILIIILLFNIFVIADTQKIISLEHFNTVLEKSEEKLLVLDFYADWCGPCKILSPTIEKISNKKNEKASFYKINVDKFPQISKLFGIKGIPFIVFVKNKIGVGALTGIQPEMEYIKLIDKFSSPSFKINANPSGFIKKLSPTQSATLISAKQPIILDVRTEREYKDGHIPNSKLIPVQVLEKRVTELSKYKNREILIYCRSGNRSTSASNILNQQGFTKLYNLKTGIKGWIKAGYKVVK